MKNKQPKDPHATNKTPPPEKKKIPWRSPPVPRVTEAEYTATIERLDGPTQSHNRDWKLIATVCLRSPDKAFGVRLPLYFNLGPDCAIGSESKLGLALRVLADYYTVPFEEVPEEALLEFYYRVNVRTVTTRRKKGHHVRRPEACWHSVVDDIVKVIGKRSELPPECWLPGEEKS